MRRLHRYSIRHPARVVAIAVLVTLAIAPGIARLRLRTDGHALVPQNAPAVKLDRAVRSEFGIRDPILVVIRPRDPSGIYNPRALHLVAELTTALGRIPGLDSAGVRSLATEVGDRFRPGTFTHRRLLDPVPETPEQIEELKGDVEAVGLLTGTFVSLDGGAAAIHVETPLDGDRTALVAAVHEAIARADTAGHDVDVIGAPVAEALLGSHILDDLGIGRAENRPERLADERWARDSNARDAGGALARARVAVARHLGLLPLSIVLMALVFLVCFRSLAATALPLLEAGACLVVVFGLMGWSGVPVYLTMAVLPVILVSMGLADEIHVFTCYSRARLARPRAPIAEVVGEAMDEMCLPVVATSMTTAVGFLSFAISPLPPVRAFGLFTAIGILFCMLWTLTAIPALLVLLAPREFRSRDRTGCAPRAAGPRMWGALAAGLGRRPFLTLALAMIGLALTPLGIRRLTVQDSWISGFAPQSAFYRATQYFNRHFFGAHRLLLALDTGRVDLRGRLAADDMDLHELRLPADVVSDPRTLVGCAVAVTRTAPPVARADDRPTSWDSFVESAARRDGRVVITTPITHGSARFLLQPAPGETLGVALHSQRLARPDVLRRVDELERFARAESLHTVGGALGPPDLVAAAEFLTSDRVAGSRVIPRDPDRVRWLWSAIAQVQEPRRLRETVDPEFRRGLVTVFMTNANFVDTRHLMSALRAFERRRLAPERIRMEFAGDVAVSQTLIDAIVRSQVGSLLGSLLGIFAVTALLFRSPRWGALCMVPAGFAVAATFAVMGAAAMPLGVATSMFASMSLGIGVDFAIHLIERYRLATARGATRDAAILDSLAATGPPIVVNALAVALGFGVLILSRVPANARLGAITVVSLLTCLAATLLVMPALLRVAKPSGGSDASGE